MNRRSKKLWRVVVWLFTLINVGGAVFAVALGEGRHAAVHVGLLLLAAAAYFVWRSAPRSERQELPSVQPAEEILDQLQQSVDAIALEVERIGEAQRFNAKLLVERAETHR